MFIYLFIYKSYLETIALQLMLLFKGSLLLLGLRFESQLKHLDEIELSI